MKKTILLILLTGTVAVYAMGFREQAARKENPMLAQTIFTSPSGQTEPQMTTDSRKGANDGTGVSSDVPSSHPDAKSGFHATSPHSGIAPGSALTPASGMSPSEGVAPASGISPDNGNSPEAGK